MPPASVALSSLYGIYSSGKTSLASMFVFSHDSVPNITSGLM